MPKLSIVTLGCPKNRVDSEAVRERLELDGFSYAAEPEDAEIVCVNTCGFIEDAKRESVEEIIRLKELKKRGKKLGLATLCGGGGVSMATAIELI